MNYMTRSTDVEFVLTENWNITDELYGQSSSLTGAKE